ncbi:hypothetical protein ILFOPFJJ_06167 [Ensifer psoraleae]|uniref:hypothetical protein n=1 Tax=Sinorhizobium psoraleae TaxID=520838 RepID=UPI001569D98C|nr:hypothetical protein [Sinorhizobium psoraleae]NRP75244.1 hypothetical protein [Sinorhizobium psoraleae]
MKASYRPLFRCSGVPLTAVVKYLRSTRNISNVRGFPKRNRIDLDPPTLFDNGSLSSTGPTLTTEQLHWILDGIDIDAMVRPPVRQYQVAG